MNPEQGRYVVTVGGSSWAADSSADFNSIRECRAYAESYGTTADYAYIADRRGRLVAAHHRDRSGDGTRWYRSAP